MFANKAFDRLRQMFADQFEPIGDGFLYRKSMKAAPILVSATEHARYLAAYTKFIKYGFRTIVIGTLAVTLGIGIYATATNMDVSDIAVYVGIGTVITVFLAANHWAWNLPARELRGRGIVGAAKSRAEMRKFLLKRLTYGQLFAGLALPVFIIFAFVAKGDWTPGWNWLWVGVSILFIIIVAIQTFRKWRADSLPL